MSAFAKINDIREEIYSLYENGAPVEFDGKAVSNSIRNSRDTEVVLHMLANVQQKTIQPLLKQAIQVGSLIFTDEYDIYARLDEWGFQHKTVNHSAGEYARDHLGFFTNENE